MTKKYETRVNPLEKTVVIVAVIVSALHLGLIAFAAMKLGVSVPDCVLDVEPFDQAQFIQHDEKTFEVHMLSRMWAFEPPLIRVPAGSTIDFYVTSVDVVHGLHLAGTNVNLMAVPGLVNNARVRFDEPGRFHVICHEYCGIGHQDMGGFIEIVEGLEAPEVPGYQVITEAEPLAQLETETLEATPQTALALLNQKGCMACHTVDGRQIVGPTFKGIYGRETILADGRRLVADEAYLLDAIVNPQKDIVEGYNIPMPKLPLTEEEAQLIIQFLKEEAL